MAFSSLVLVAVSVCFSDVNTCKPAAGGVLGTCFHNPEARLKSSKASVRKR